MVLNARQCLHLALTQRNGDLLRGRRREARAKRTDKPAGPPRRLAPGCTSGGLQASSGALGMEALTSVDPSCSSSSAAGSEAEGQEPLGT